MRYRILKRLIFFGYLGYLTILLLTRDPLRWVEFTPSMNFWIARIMPWAHLVSFFLLTVLAVVARWPLPWWGLGAALCGYAASTEILQSLTGRDPEWNDFIQDCAGIGIGLAGSWLTLLLVRSFHKSPASAKVQESS
jgi:hypothetical protein